MIPLSPPSAIRPPLTEARSSLWRDAWHRLKKNRLAVIGGALLDKPWTHGLETAIDLTLLGRYYERYADHAVSVARRVYFMVKGEYA